LLIVEGISGLLTVEVTGGVLTGAGFWGLLLVEAFGGVTTVEGGFVTVAGTPLVRELIC
jgi:hypothetical protein